MIGVPWRLIRWKTAGTSLLTDIEYTVRVPMPSHTQPVAAGESAASDSSTIENHVKPAATTAFSSGADAQSLPRRPVQSPGSTPAAAQSIRSEEHTSELQSRQYLVCRLLLEKK